MARQETVLFKMDRKFSVEREVVTQAVIDTFLKLGRKLPKKRKVIKIKAD